MQKHATEITKDELIGIINSYAHCPDLKMITINHLEYFDFDKDGKDEAVVVASTCGTGTAGPDIHAVYTRGADGKVMELPMSKLPFESDPRKVPLFGNRNDELKVEDGQVVARWKDTSDRENPLVVWYRWNGKGFVVDHMKVEGPFHTSYDCAKATNEMDRAICYSPRVAALDVQLDQAYRAKMQKLPAEKRRALQDEQRQWLIDRNKCINYKWWVDCLTEVYKNRLAELRQNRGNLLKSASTVPRNLPGAHMGQQPCADSREDSSFR